MVIKSLDVQFLGGGGGGVSPAGHPPGFAPDLQKSYKIEKKAFRHFNGILMASQSS